MNQLVTELPKIEAEVDFQKVNRLSADDIVRESATLHERWPTLERDAKRKIVIDTAGGEIDITYSYVSTSIELCKSQQGLKPG